MFMDSEFIQSRKDFWYWIKIRVSQTYNVCFYIRVSCEIIIYIKSKSAKVI